MVAPPPDAIRIMNTATKGDHQLSGSLILIGWRSLSPSNLMHNAPKSESTLRMKSCACGALRWNYVTIKLILYSCMEGNWGTFPPLHALTTGSCPVQPAFIYWPLSNSEQLVVKCLVQGHLDGTLQKKKKPLRTSKILGNVKKRATINSKKSYLDEVWWCKLCLTRLLIY